MIDISKHRVLLICERNEDYGPSFFLVTSNVVEVINLIGNQWLYLLDNNEKEYHTFQEMETALHINGWLILRCQVIQRVG